jgi:cytochrome c biogenesis protein CcdA
MTDLFWTLSPILLTDALNPVLFAFMVYAAGTERPILNSSFVLLGHTTAYFAAGIVLALGIERISERLANPERIDFVIEIVLGLVLLWVAAGSRKDTGKRPEEESPALGPAAAFGLGATVNFIGIPFAVPYFAALSQILQADLSTTGALTVLGLYNFAYALPFTAVPLMVWMMGDRSRPLLEKINGVLERVSGVLMPILMGLIGLALLADGIVYFARGESLF